MRFTLLAIALGLTSSVFAQRNREGNDRELTGQTPADPLYVDATTNALANPLLFPANTYLDSEQTAIFRNLVRSIVDAQQELSYLAHDSREFFAESLEQWEALQGNVQDYRVLRETDYTRPLEALRKALLSLETPSSRGNNRQVDNQDAQDAVEDALTRLLLDNLYLSGFFNNVYDDATVPTALIDQPSEIVGILTRYLAIDVNKALDFWPDGR